MNYKINMFSFVFSFTFLIGVGASIAKTTHWIFSIIILLIGSFGYIAILRLAEDLLNKKEKNK